MSVSEISGKDFQITFQNVERFEGWIKDTYNGTVDEQAIYELLEELEAMHEFTGECTYELPADETISGHTECISYKYEIKETNGCYHETYTF